MLKTDLDMRRKGNCSGLGEISTLDSECKHSSTKKQSEVWCQRLRVDGASTEITGKAQEITWVSSRAKPLLRARKKCREAVQDDSRDRSACALMIFFTSLSLESSEGAESLLGGARGTVSVTAGPLPLSRKSSTSGQCRGVLSVMPRPPTR